MAPRHINDDDVELYALDRLADADDAPVEEHLLVCEKCRERLVGWDAYVGAMRAAMEASDSAMGLRHLRTTLQGVRR